MTVFQYVALDESGGKVTGHVEAASAKAVAEIVRRGGDKPLGVGPVGTPLDVVWPDQRPALATLWREAMKHKPTVLGAAWHAARLDKSDGERLAIIDAEIFCYQAIMESLVEKEVDDGQWTWHVDAKETLSTIVARIEETAAFIRAEQVVLCFGSKSNWRKRIMPEYKAHRSRKKPLGYWSIVASLREMYFSVSRPFLEADDVAGLIHTAPSLAFLKLPELETVVVSEDKDYLTLPGLLYNPRAETQELVKITRDQADRAHMLQTLSGDSADGYKGCPGVGAVTGARALDAAGRGAWWYTVKRLFGNATDTTEADALLTARVARILRHGEYDWESGEMTLWTPELLEVK